MSKNPPLVSDKNLDAVLEEGNLTHKQVMYLFQAQMREKIAKTSGVKYGEDNEIDQEIDIQVANSGSAYLFHTQNGAKNENLRKEILDFSKSSKDGDKKIFLLYHSSTIPKNISDLDLTKIQDESPATHWTALVLGKENGNFKFQYADSLNPNVTPESIVSLIPAGSQEQKYESPKQERAECGYMSVYNSVKMSGYEIVENSKEFVQKQKSFLEREENIKREVATSVNKIENLPIKEIGKEITIDPANASAAFTKAKEFVGTKDTEAAEIGIEGLKATSKDSFFNLYANIAKAVLTSKIEDVPQKEKDDFLKNLTTGFSFLENEDDRSKDGDMEKAFQTMQDLGKSSSNQVIQNILKSSLQETFLESTKLIDETQKEESKELLNSPVGDKKESEEKNKSKEGGDASNSLKQGGRAAMALAIALTAISPAGPIMVVGAIAFLYATRNFGKDEDKKNQSKQDKEDALSQENLKYSEAWKEFMTPTLNKKKEEMEERGKKTNSEEVSEKLAKEAKKELEAVEKSLEEKRAELQDQNKKVHQDLLEKPAEQVEEEVKKEEKNNLGLDDEREEDNFLKAIGNDLSDEEFKKAFGGGIRNFDDIDDKKPVHGIDPNLKQDEEEKNKNNGREIF